MFFRRTTRDDPRLPAKIALFTVGALLAIVGMILENDWVIVGAAVILLAGMALRFSGPPDNDKNGPSEAP
ncbi:MAG TPA: hypothetical protein VMM83_04485 [Longimicrobiales bacterium]|nr:hypothetical protein [Longimicrobiales bacterium]